jgi:pyridoxamine 5'-phosphate oxidase
MAYLREEDFEPDPISQFALWHDEAGRDAAVAVVTATPAGEPSGRMVLLKGVDEEGFVFFTNYESAKAADLEANPRAALVFHWPPVRQVRVTGSVSRVSPAEADAYWVTRPRASQLGAWASPQSRVIGDRSDLEAALREVSARFSGAPVPRPEFWGGYRVVPEAVEFWQHQEDRLHDRLRYRRGRRGWLLERLAP